MKLLLSLNLILSAVYFEVFTTTFPNDDVLSLEDQSTSQDTNLLKDYVGEEQDIKEIVNKVTILLVSYNLKKGIDAYISAVPHFNGNLFKIQNYFSKLLGIIMILNQKVTESREDLWNEIEDLDYSQLEELINESYKEIHELKNLSEDQDDKIINQDKLIEDLEKYYERVREMELELYKEILENK
ncbi:hypothetical protein NBO_55g0012 [Nosema bombycis CQ1]|uniref:Uncharacterized protein n=1 Tax=Nosema bombycis (strain CQ1 / CVCC 102059) TaxID=578461 RepID=R0MLY8_NOSB1|nr:hypothetical protein NBO_55g0012 [Nosema bombycis CQ1]|eukprot:EOB13848.1 hypothetical protein NBO_55g0012 [Nosema bombycis CQ1]